MIELVQHGVVALQAGKLPVFIQEPQTKAVEGAPEGFVDVEADAQGIQPVRNSGLQFSGGFFGEGYDQERFRRNVLLRDQVGNAFN